VREVDLGPVVLALLDQVHQPEGVVGRRDGAAVLGLDGDVVAEPVAAEPIAGQVGAEPQRRLP
jgi:hypothetical protein